MYATIEHPSGGECTGLPASPSRRSRLGSCQSISKIGLRESERRLIVSPRWIPCFPDCQARLVNIFRSVQKDLLSPTRLGLRVDSGPGPIQQLICLFPPLGILQNNAASMVIDSPPLFDLLQRAEAAETGIVIVEAAISHARRAVGITHLLQAPLRELRIGSHGRRENRASITRPVRAFNPGHLTRYARAEGYFRLER